MKKSFITGVISGLCGALLLCSIIAAVFIMVDDKTADGNSGNNDSQIETQDKNKASKEQPYEEVVKKLSYLEMLVDNYYLEEVDQTAFADGIFKGFMSSLHDPYSTYYTKEEYRALIESSSGVYHGIGATVSKDVKTGIITIIRPFETGPAYKAGILPGDIIYKVENEEVTGLDLIEVVSKMKGVEGTSVRISIIREGITEPLEFEITRREIHVPTIEHEMLVDQIGYISIVEFDEITVSQFKKAIDELQKSGMKGLVIDLRNNPGGLLESVVRMLDRFIDKGLIVYTEDKHGKRVEEKAKSKDKLTIPLAVIINGNSASASEIFAGAVQDYELGTVVGTTSFGKGIVQKVIPLTDGTAVKLTISKYYTPKGRNIHGTGIAPDVEVELVEEMKKEVSIPKDKDNQLQEAIKIVKEKINKIR